MARIIERFFSSAVETLFQTFWGAVYLAATGIVIGAVVAILGRLQQLDSVWTDRGITALVVCAIFGTFAVLRIMFRKRQNDTPQPSPTETRLPISSITTVEGWTKAGSKLEQIINRKFSYENVQLDGRNYIGCSFVHVNFFYDGTAPMALTNCQFDADSVQHFHSHSPGIAQWTEFLRTLGALKPDIRHSLTPHEPNR